MCKKIIGIYDDQIESLFRETQPGPIRSKKGRLVEEITKELITSGWVRVGGDMSRIEFATKKIQIKLDPQYVQHLPDDLKENLQLSKFQYGIKVDIHCHIDGEFVLGVECKSYTENAMLKRILVDFWLIKKLFPKLICCLVQLETFLGGVNDRVGSSDVANKSSYTLMSYFPDVNLEILTMLEGARDINRPIHKREFAKTLKPEYVMYALEHFSVILKKYV